MSTSQHTSKNSALCSTAVVPHCTVAHFQPWKESFQSTIRLFWKAGLETCFKDQSNTILAKKFGFSNSVDKAKILCTTSPPTQHHSFFRNYLFCTIFAKFRAFKRFPFEDTEECISPEIRPKSFGTFEKRAPDNLHTPLFIGNFKSCLWPGVTWLSREPLNPNHS